MKSQPEAPKVGEEHISLTWAALQKTLKGPKQKPRPTKNHYNVIRAIHVSEYLWYKKRVLGEKKEVYLGFPLCNALFLLKSCP